MTAKKLKPGLNDVQLFVTLDDAKGAGEKVAWKPPEKVAAVNILERNQRLTEVLKSFGLISQKRGLRTASMTSPSDKEINDRYGSKTVRVVANTIDRANRLEKETKWPFSQATGRFVLHDAGVTTYEEAGQITSDMFEDYKDKFAGPGNRDARDQEIKRLKQHSQAFIDAESSQKAS